MRRLLKRFTRAGGFITKEMNEVRRQPRLILALILGPFLILLLFGIGYQGESSRLNAIIVIPAVDGYSRDVQEYQKMVSNQLSIVQVTTDKQAALDRLKRHDVDMVVQVPQNVSQQISSGSQVRIPIYINEVDPVRRDWIRYLAYIYTNEINKNTIAAAASQGQQNAGDVRSALIRMKNSLAAIEGRLGTGQPTDANRAQAQQEVQGMQSSSANVQLAVLIMAQLLASNNVLIQPAQHQNPQEVDLAKGQDTTRQLSADIQTLNDDLASPATDPGKAKQDMAKVRNDLDTLDRLTQQFQSINPLVLAAPFYPQTEDVAPITPSFTSFYAPGVLVLLLQHIAVTLAALSMVRERLLGTFELFRVSPVSPTEILIGKYIGFMILLGIVSVVLLLMMSNDLTIGGFRLSLGVPILGDWVLLAVTLAFVVFASIGLGFFISTISRSESQAVQLSMLVLLTSVFFSGFFLRLEALWPPVQAVSYALPVTYGIKGLEVIMLRGGVPTPALLLSLLFLGTFFGLLGFIMFNREFRKG